MTRAKTPGRYPAVAVGGGAIVSVLLLFVVIYVLSVLFWSIWLMLGVGWSGAENWSYLYTITHWGLLTPIASSFLLGKRG